MANESLMLTTTERIEWCRRRLGIKPRHLAAMTGLSPATLYNYRAGIRPIPSGALKALAVALARYSGVALSCITAVYH